MMLSMSVSVLLLLAFSSVVSEVVDFSKCREFFFDGKPPEIPAILEKSCSKNSQYRTICQKYGGQYKYATFYNKEKRIPVFSAYKFHGDVKTDRPSDEWMVEPQLEDPSDEMGTPYENQATDEDYFNTELKEKHNVNRGHLFPCCHSAGDVDTARSTFTLTNSVPQKESFNKGSWNRMEIETIKNMAKYCRDPKNIRAKKVLAHVLTGAVPGNVKLNERVNIPSFMWMTFCCYNISTGSWISQSYWAPNQVESEADHVIINKITLQELQKNLSTWVKGIQLFGNDCNNK